MGSDDEKDELDEYAWTECDDVLSAIDNDSIALLKDVLEASSCPAKLLVQPLQVRGYKYAVPSKCVLPPLLFVPRRTEKARHCAGWLYCGAFPTERVLSSAFQQDGGRALHHAAAVGSVAVVVFLLERGVEVDAIAHTSGRSTALHWAATAGQARAPGCA